MMDLWWKIAGCRRIRLTGADLIRTLRLLSREVRLEQIEWETALTLTAVIARKDAAAVERIASELGDKVQTVAEYGLPQKLHWWKARPILAGFLVVLTVLSLWLPSRVLFIRVEGNREVPTDLILESAAQCGVRFGAVRRELRSEQVKNQLLHMVPQLGWAGVNTCGCVATLTVREREQKPQITPRECGNVVAAKSGIVTEFTATAGTPLCAVGEAVQEGQVLISGVTDLGLSTRVSAARGEVFAGTVTEISARLPEKNEVRAEKGEVARKVSVIFGKKRINLYSDSGILAPGCGKMREAIPLSLPGGWQLPVTLVIDTYSLSQWQPHSRQRWEAEEMLLRSIRREILGHSVAGQILREQLEFSAQDGCFQLEGKVGCREMIGRYTEGVYLEDDVTDDRSSGERGAG